MMAKYPLPLTLRTVGFSFAEGERKHCGQLSAFPSRMLKFVSPHVMHLTSVPFVRSKCLYNASQKKANETESVLILKIGER